MDDATAELAVAEVEARAAAEAAVGQLDEPEPTIEELEAEVVAMRETPPDEADAEPPSAPVAEQVAREDAPPEDPDVPAEPTAAAEPPPPAPVIDLRERPVP